MSVKKTKATKYGRAELIGRGDLLHGTNGWSNSADLLIWLILVTFKCYNWLIQLIQNIAADQTNYGLYLADNGNFNS